MLWRSHKKGSDYAKLENKVVRCNICPNRSTLTPTPLSTLERFREIALEKDIHYEYIGNIPGHTGNNTHCHNCKKPLIKRREYQIPVFNLDGNKCTFCQTVIPGVWQQEILQRNS